MTDAYLYPHTCTIQRRPWIGVDGSNQPVYGDYATSTASQECRFADEGTFEQLGRAAIQLETPKLFLPYSASILAGDRIANIKDSTGSIIWAGPFEVDGRPRDPGGEHDHLEADLTAVTA